RRVLFRSNLKKVVEAQESPKNDTTIALDYYQETLDKLSNSVNELSEAQLHFKATDSTWSISQCLEHIIITEDMIFGMIKGYMEQPENPERRRSEERRVGKECRYRG